MLSKTSIFYQSFHHRLNAFSTASFHHWSYHHIASSPLNYTLSISEMPECLNVCSCFQSYRVTSYIFSPLCQAQIQSIYQFSCVRASSYVLHKVPWRCTSPEAFAMLILAPVDRDDQIRYIIHFFMRSKYSTRIHLLIFHQSCRFLCVIGTP